MNDSVELLQRYIEFLETLLHYLLPFAVSFGCLRFTWHLIFDSYHIDLFELPFILFNKKPKEENTEDVKPNPKKVNLSKLSNEPRGFFDDE